MTAATIGMQGLRILQLAKPIVKPLIKKAFNGLKKKIPKVIKAVKKVAKVATKLPFAKMSIEMLKQLAENGSQNQKRKAKKYLALMENTLG
jgi:hypothetical protein